VPAVLVLMVEVVAPVLHAKVAAPVPPAGVAVSVAGSVLAQTSTLAIETVGFGSTVRVPSPEPVQPFVSVTVTLYVPVVLVLMVEVVAPVLHAKLFAPVPPAGVAVSVAGSVLAQTSTAAMETVGLGLTVRVPSPEPVQPFVSVTVTL
jgi:type III secretory pathway component EscT